MITPKVDLVLTKHAATECLENGQCVRTGRAVAYSAEQFLENVVLGATPAQSRADGSVDLGSAPFSAASSEKRRQQGFDMQVLHAGDPGRQHPICFEVVAQRWRPWAGDGHTIQSFRARALHACGIPDKGMRRKLVLLRRDSTTRRWRDEGALKKQLEVLARSIGSTFYIVNLGQLDPCQQVSVLHDSMLVLGVHGADLTNMIYLPPGAAVVELAVECEVEGGSVDTPQWRGPGTRINGSIYDEAAGEWRRQSSAGTCPLPGETYEDWLQGYPVSQFAKLARQANLLYVAVTDCAGSHCPGRQPMADVWDRGWCSSDVKKREFITVDTKLRVIPTIWTIFDEHLRHMT